MCPRDQDHLQDRQIVVLWASGLSKGPQVLTSNGHNIIWTLLYMSFVICECPKIISVFERGVTYVINIKLPAVITSRGKLATQNSDNDVFFTC